MNKKFYINFVRYIEINITNYINIKTSNWQSIRYIHTKGLNNIKSSNSRGLFIPKNKQGKQIENFISLYYNKTYIRRFNSCSNFLLYDRCFFSPNTINSVSVSGFIQPLFCINNFVRITRKR